MILETAYKSQIRGQPSEVGTIQTLRTRICNADIRNSLADRAPAVFSDLRIGLVSAEPKRSIERYSIDRVLNTFSLIIAIDLQSLELFCYFLGLFGIRPIKRRLSLIESLSIYRFWNTLFLLVLQLVILLSICLYKFIIFYFFSST